MRIEYRDVHVELGKAEILHGASVTAEDGHVTGVIGANGSGKSTLIKTTFGIAPLSGGDVLVGGKSISEIGRRELASLVGYVGQESSSVFDFSVHDIVAMAAGLRAENSGKKSAEIVREALEELGIAHLEERGIQSLSGGERKMVYIARAFAQGVDTVLLDEPTNHLDIKHQLFILRHLRESEKTVLIVLHDLRLAAHFCDELYLMRQGEVICHGTPAEVLTEENVTETFGVRGWAELREGIGTDFRLLME